MNGLNGPKGNNFDESFVAQSMPYNSMRAQNRFIKTRGDWQVTWLAVKHGIYSGSVYGGAFGLGVAIYKRQLRHIPIYAAGLAIPYASYLSISTVYRMDI